MGSSARKKREKKKDFQVRCGTPPNFHASLSWPETEIESGQSKTQTRKSNRYKFSLQRYVNITHYCFKLLIASLAIVLNQQSLHVDAPSAPAQFNHHVSLLSSRSDTQRRDALNYLTAYVHSRVVDTPLPTPISSLLGKLCPLILDGTASVRTQLLKLLSSLPPADIKDHVATILPYVRAGMTHLSADIRSSSVNILSWMIEAAGDDLLSCPGGWQKTLDCFITTLGWHIPKGGSWSTRTTTVSKFAADSKLTARNLQVLAEFITAGIGPGVSQSDGGKESEPALFPLWHTYHHMIPRKANAYGYLNLFGMPTNDDNQILDDREDRHRIFDELYRKLILTSLEVCKKEGGEQGRAAALVTKAMKEASVE